MVKPSDLVRPPKPAPPCPTPDKRAYRSQAAARRAHRNSYWSNPTFGHETVKPKLFAYECRCLAWHLTSQEPKKRKTK